MRKKLEFLKSQLDVDEEAEHTPESDDSDVSEEEEVKPIKKKAGPRAGVSAEVYGEWNKKSDFVPKVIPKSEQTKESLRKRLL
jgi:cAMP-dependent protein kinase regulator